MISDKPDEFAWPKPPQPPAAVSDSIRRCCTKDLTPRAPLRPGSRVIGSILVSGGLFAILLTLGWMRHPPQRAVALALLGALAWGLVQALILYVSHGRPPGLRSERPLRWVLLLGVATLYVAYLALNSTGLLSFHDFVEVPRSLRGTFVCGIHALLFGGLASIVLFLIWRRTDPISPRLTGALTGLAGGLVGSVALDMTCTNQEGWHLLLGHGAVLLALIVGGWFVGRRWLVP